MSGNTNNTVFIQRLFSSRDNFTEGNVQEATSNALAFVGQQDRIWWEPTTNSFYYSDGNTPGGIPIGGGGGSNISNGNSNVNIATSNGNVSITSNGTYTWTFDGTGNLVLPANSFNVNYANGTQVPLGGGDLPIANGTSSIDIPTANSFVTITSNTYWTWFFGPDGSLILPQNSATGNIGAIVGPYGANTIIRAPTAGSAFVENNASFNKLSVSDSNITISTSPNSGSTYNNWIFSTNGNLNIPTSINSATDTDISIRAIDGGKGGLASLVSFKTSTDTVTSIISAGTTNVTIGTNVSGNTNYWSFSNTGALTVPGNIISLAGGASRLNLNDSGNSISLTSGSADQFGGNIQITSGNAACTTSGTGGSVTLLSGSGFDRGGRIRIISGTGTDGGNVDINSGPGNRGGIITIQPGNSFDVDSIGSALNLKGGNNSGNAGGIVNITGGNGTVGTGGGNVIISGGGPSANSGNVYINSSTNTWTFDNTGNLTLPANSFNVNYANGTQVSLNITPAYGQFWSNLSQTVASPNTEYKFLFNNSDPTSNVVLGTGASNSRIIINQTGLYNIQFSAQVDKTGGGTSSAYIWFKKNGTAVTDSSGFITLDAAIQTVESWNILANVTTAGDYYEIAYASSSTNFSFPTIAGNNIVGYPASPSIIVTVTPL